MHLSKQKCYDITRYNSNLFTTNDSRKETMKRSKLKSSFDRYRVWRAWKLVPVWISKKILHKPLKEDKIEITPKIKNQTYNRL